MFCVFFAGLRLFFGATIRFLPNQPHGTGVVYARFHELLAAVREIDTDGVFDVELLPSNVDVPADYFEHIRQPIDLVKIERKCRQFNYVVTADLKVVHC